MASWIAGASALTVAEADGAPSVSGVNTILVTNTTLTDNTGGSVTIAMTPAGGANTALSNLAAVAVSAALTTGAGTAAALTATKAVATASSAEGIAATLTASAATAGSTNAGAAAGGSVTITSGAAAQKTSGNAAGGDIIITPGAGIGTGAYGILRPSADNILALGSAAYRLTTAFASTGFSIYKAVSEANPTATLGDGVLNFGAGTSNAVDSGIARIGAAEVKISNASTGYGSIRTSALKLFDAGTHFSIFQAQTQVADLTYTLPAAHGTGYLYDDGAGALAWGTPAGTGANTALSNLTAVAINAPLTTGAGTAAALTATPPTQTASAQAGIAAGLTASAAVAGSSNVGAAAGGSVTITAGAAAQLTSGNAAGGDVVLTPGAGIGTGANGIVNATGPLRVPDGTYAVPSIAFASGAGIYENAAIYGIGFSCDNHSVYAGMGQGGLFLGSTGVVYWSTTDPPTGSVNLGLLSLAPGVLKVTNGSTGNGNIVASTAITAVGTAAHNGVIRTGVYKRAWTNAEVTAFGGVLTGDLKVATLPAKTIIRNAYVVIDSQAAGTTTLTAAMGRTGAAYIDYIVASNAKVAANTVYGDAVAERGTNLTGYDLPSYTADVDVYVQFVSTVENLSAVTSCTGTVYLLTETLP